MKACIILSLLLLSACGAKRSSFKIGETTRADVITEKGEPLSEEKIPEVKDGSMLKFKNNESIQLKGDLVSNRFTNPTGDEKLVMWWKHKFKSCPFMKTTTLPQDPKAHTQPEVEMACPEQGLSVIYTQGSDTISRVVEYEKK
jgi:hypothetical protein